MTMTEEEAYQAMHLLTQPADEGSRYTYSTEHGHTIYYTEGGHHRFELCCLTPLGWVIDSMIKIDRRAPFKGSHWAMAASCFMPEGELMKREKERMPKDSAK